MAGKPKEARLLAHLQRLATTECGVDSTPLDFIEQHVADGGTMNALRERLIASGFGEDLSRSWLSRVANSLPNARERIAAARNDGAWAVLEDAENTAKEAALTRNRDAIAGAKLLIDLAVFRAKVQNPDMRENRASLHINVGQLHLDALRQRATAIKAAAIPRQLAPGEEILDAEVIASE